MSEFHILLNRITLYLWHIKTINWVMIIAIVEMDKTTYVVISKPMLSPLLWAVPVKSKIMPKFVK